ncbi:thioredoxin family protein [Zobellia laminariae]|uniref:thioredoxin family protein n=1 Tax=Zobellia laminariae TaxID=248906 RepID=UPI0026F46340|nr:thioredoxin family protein [Zobellia laminariae]WKX75690.1 thioredoxin family protein [Zobellia laminariae]
MKLLLFLILPLCLIGQTDTTSSVDWLKNYDKAIKVSKKENKNVLVYFTGSDWCPPCKKLKHDLFETDEFSELSKSYVLLYVDIPRNKDLLSDKQWDHNQEILKKLNKKGVFPLLTVVDGKGKALDEYSGYGMTGEIGYHLNFLKKNK